MLFMLFRLDALPAESNASTNDLPVKIKNHVEMLGGQSDVKREEAQKKLQSLDKLRTSILKDRWPYVDAEMMAQM